MYSGAHDAGRQRKRNDGIFLERARRKGIYMDSKTLDSDVAVVGEKRSVSALLMEHTPVIALILLIIVFSSLSQYFLRSRNLLNVLDQVTIYGIMSLGMTAVIVLGGIDLSVGSVLALSTMAMGWMTNMKGMPWVVAVPAAILLGGVCGLVSGLLITRLELPPFIATLAVMSIARGLANLITDGSQIIGYPNWFIDLATKRHFGYLTVTVAIFILLCIAAWLFFKYRPNGRSLYAIGGNVEVARLAGINVKLITTAAYAVSGILCGLGGVIMAARLDSSQPTAGIGYEMDCIASVVIGGASLSGGIGKVGGTIMGVLIIGVLRNGLNLTQVSPFVQQIIIGLVIIVAVVMDTLRRRTAR